MHADQCDGRDSAALLQHKVSATALREVSATSRHVQVERDLYVVRQQL